MRNLFTSTGWVKDNLNKNKVGDLLSPKHHLSANFFKTNKSLFPLTSGSGRGAFAFLLFYFPSSPTPLRISDMFGVSGYLPAQLRGSKIAELGVHVASWAPARRCYRKVSGESRQIWVYRNRSGSDPSVLDGDGASLPPFYWFRLCLVTLSLVLSRAVWGPMLRNQQSASKRCCLLRLQVGSLNLDDGPLFSSCLVWVEGSCLFDGWICLPPPRMWPGSGV